MDELIREKMRKLKLSYDAAFEEVVADSCESFLVDSNIDTTKNIAKNDGVKYITRYDKYGNPYWYVETHKDIFKGLKDIKAYEKAAY